MNWIELVESALSHDKFLYHGTSEVAWDEMKQENVMRDFSHRGTISFTWSPGVAEEFARLRAKADASWGTRDDGVVLVFNKEKLDRDYELEPFQDDRIGKNWAIQDEREIRAITDRIPDLKRYLVRIYRVKPR